MGRIRAGVLEHGFAAPMRVAGVGERMACAYSICEYKLSRFQA
jgi:hypothetical protein